MVMKILRRSQSAGRDKIRSTSAPTARYGSEFVGSDLARVTVAFAVLVLINLSTLAFGPSAALRALDESPAGALLAPFVFDSWGTVGGLAGSFLLFAPVLFGTPVAQ